MQDSFISKLIAKKFTRGIKYPCFDPKYVKQKYYAQKTFPICPQKGNFNQLFLNKYGISFPKIPE